MPILLSTLDSTLFWKSCGVVVDEKFEFITTCSSDLYFLKNELMRVVFAEPCSPISRRFLVDKSRFVFFNFQNKSIMQINTEFLLFALSSFVYC